MSNKTHFLKNCSLDLVPTSYEDSEITFIIKTHNYRGEKTEELNCKLYSGKFKDHINRKMFTPYKLVITSTETKKVISTNSKECLSEIVLNQFIYSYNKGHILKDILFAYNPETDEMLKDSTGNYLAQFYIAKTFTAEEVAQVFESLKSALRSARRAASAEIVDAYSKKLLWE